jgi:hypothetical protein
MCLPFRKKDRFTGTDRLDLVVLYVEFDLAFLDPVESAVPSLGKKYSVPRSCIGEGMEIAASGKMLSLAKQDDDARLFGRTAKECLETSDRRFVQGISLGRARQAQQRYRTALARSQSTRQDPP